MTENIVSVIVFSFTGLLSLYVALFFRRKEKQIESAVREYYSNSLEE